MTVLLCLDICFMKLFPNDKTSAKIFLRFPRDLLHALKYVALHRVHDDMGAGFVTVNFLR